MEAVKEIKMDSRLIKIFIDENAFSPRENDNLGTMICFHKRYNIGDVGHQFKSSDYSSWEELEKDLVANGYAVILPIYMYDHGGVTISTSPFSCRWDSGQVGYIAVKKKKLYEEYGVKRLTKKIIDIAEGVLKAEIEEYDNYLQGNVYGFISYEEGEEVDSCWGFIGDNFEENGLYDYAGISLK